MAAPAEVGDEEAEEKDEDAEEDAGEHGGRQLEVGGGREVVVVAVVVVGGDSFIGVPGGGVEVQGLLLALGLGVHDERDDEAVYTRSAFPKLATKEVRGQAYP